MNATSVDELLSILQYERAHGERNLVTTNGVFDLLHVGHLDCLTYAAQCGQILVVAINSDEAVRRMKGPLRPIIPQDDRQRMVGALRMVAHTFLFSEPTPCEVLEKLRPDVHVKGPGWGSAEDLPETEIVTRYGGRVVIAPEVFLVSTSLLIGEIARRYG